jgi:hypothetical protein
MESRLACRARPLTANRVAIMRHAIRHRNRQHGAVALTFALLLVFLLGFMGLALDFGHAFVVKTELQTATDACALAAAQELDGQPDALVRAKSAGKAAGNINRVNLQSAGWSGQPKLGDADITFFDNGHVSTLDPASARFVRCDHLQAGTKTPLLNVLSIQSASPVYAATIDVRAFAEATTTPSQSTCPLPLGLVARNTTKPGTGLPNYGFERGEWVVLVIQQQDTPGGQVGWANLDAGKGASDIVDQLKGYCGSKTDSQVMRGSPGTMSSLIEYWNRRFGIYKGKLADQTPEFLSVNQPDFTGYGFTSANWTAKDKNGKNCCAYDNKAVVKDTTHKTFLAHRQAFSTCVGNASSSTDLQKDCGAQMGYQKLVTGQAAAVTGGPAGALHDYGTNRRVMPVPVVGSGLTNNPTKIIDFACMLMLQPMPDTSDKTVTQIYLEYLGNAAEPDSPCRASGLPGGTAGPLVPVLVR